MKIILKVKEYDCSSEARNTPHHLNIRYIWGVSVREGLPVCDRKERRALKISLRTEIQSLFSCKIIWNLCKFYTINIFKIFLRPLRWKSSEEIYECAMISKYIYNHAKRNAYKLMQYWQASTLMFLSSNVSVRKEVTGSSKDASWTSSQKAPECAASKIAETPQGSTTPSPELSSCA